MGQILSDLCCNFNKKEEENKEGTNGVQEKVGTKFFGSFKRDGQSSQPSQTIATVPKIKPIREPRNKPRNAVLFLVALNYKGTEAQLDGTDDDIVNSVNLLNYLDPDLTYNKMYFGADTPERAKEIAARFDMKFADHGCIFFSGTKAEIKKYFDEALASMDANDDFMWTSFSGHGCGIEDYNYDETDNQDEAFYTVDQRLVVDDEFKDMINKYPNKKVINFFDCCHSGTILDLDNTSENAVSICACKDSQQAQEVSLGDATTGVMTMNILKLAKEYFSTPVTFLFMSYAEMEESLHIMIGEGMEMEQLASIFPKGNKVNTCLGYLMYKNDEFVQEKIWQVENENVIEVVTRLNNNF